MRRGGKVKDKPGSAGGVLDLVKIVLIASLSQILGFRETEIEIDDISIRELGVELLKRNPEFSVIFSDDGSLKPGYLLLVNDTDYRLLGEEYRIKKNDIVAILPVSHGG